MKTQAAALSADERLKIASLLGTAVTTERPPGEIPNPCWSGNASRVTASTEGLRYGPVGEEVSSEYAFPKC